MAVPSASGSGIINKPTAYGASSQVTSDNLNQHVDNAVFNANAVDGVTINADSNGKNLFVVDGSISVAKTSFLGTVDTTANSTVRILSKQSDGQYDSVTPSGDVAMSQSGAFTIQNNSVTGNMILNSSLQISRLASIADQTIVGNNDGSASAPEALTASEVIGVLGTNLINPASGLDNNTNSITFSNGLIVKFDLVDFAGGGDVSVSYDSAFPNHCYGVLTTINTDASESSSSVNSYARNVTTSGFSFKSFSASDHDGFYIAVGR